MEASSCSCRSGQVLASTSTIIRACPHHYVPPTIIGCFSPNEPAHPAVVASPRGSTCLHQEITLQTCPLTLQTCSSSIGVLPGWNCYSARYSCALLPLSRWCMRVQFGILPPRLFTD